MLKAIAMLGVLAALGGGTYVAVQCTDCGSAADAASAQVVSAEACTECCPSEAAATEVAAAPCPAEGKTEDSTNVTASATPAPAELAPANQ